VIVECDADGWYWPTADQHARRLVAPEADHEIPRIIAHCRGRDTIVQAGGNVGVWAKRLAAHFRCVLTFEPDRLNYACLLLNDMPANVRSMHAALGAEPGWVGVELHEPDNFGATRVTDSGPVRQIAIDSLALGACDSICLDVEGAELAALRGATQTIERFGPVIIAENKGLGGRYGVEAGQLESFLAGLNYRVIDQMGRDTVFAR
jgi:FkbM family methyltransferase